MGLAIFNRVYYHLNAIKNRKTQLKSNNFARFLILKSVMKSQQLLLLF